MADTKTTARTSPEELSAFRATVLLHFRHQPEASEITRRLGVSLAELGIALERLLGGSGRHAITDELRAAAVDLRALQTFLFRIGRAYVDRDLSPADRRLSRLASKLATRAGGLAATIEDALPASRPD
jgi:hypothetical protein